MASRLDLHNILLGISENVYFQPPESIKIRYPAIVYFRRNIENVHADDASYLHSNSYEITVIDRDPESELMSKISELPMCRYDRHFTSDGLNHDVFIIYY